MGAEYPGDIKVDLVAIDNTRLEIELSDEVKKAGDKLITYILDDVNSSRYV